MFKSAATKIAHNTTLPALAGNSDLRPLQDLITAEKTVLTSLQKLRVDFAKAGDALRIWGQGEGDDLADILAASTALLGHFAVALSTYSSLHHTVRDNMKSVRAREEALDDLRRRRRRVGANAEAAEKKLNKMSPEHKNLAAQTEMLNRLREEMRAMDGEIIREEAEIGDFKRKCTKNWMIIKFGGLVECCQKGVIVGDIGKQITQFISEDVTQPGLPRAYYNAHSPVGDLAAEAQRAVSQVAFSSSPSGHAYGPMTEGPHSQPPSNQPTQGPVQSPYLPTPSLGSELTLGVNALNMQQGNGPVNKRSSVDELGIQGPSTSNTLQFSSLPNREREPAPSLGPAGPLSFSGPLDAFEKTADNQSFMASMADALSQSHRGFSLEEATSVAHTHDEPAPKYEPLTRAVRSETHEPNGHTSVPDEGRWPRRATRRSTSPPSLPPGAAPAAIRAWDDKTGQGEDGAHSDRPASSSPRVPSQRPISSLERDGEEVDGLAYDRDDRSQVEVMEKVDGNVTLDEERSLRESGEAGGTDVRDLIVVKQSSSTTDDPESSSLAASHIQETLSVTTSVNNAASTSSNTPSPLRAESQRRIPRVPPPSAETDPVNTANSPATLHEASQSNVGSGVPDVDMQTDESADERARNAAAAREVSRELDALAFTAIAPSSGYAPPAGPPPGYVSPMSYASQSQVNLRQSSLHTLQGSPAPSIQASYRSAPSSPIIPSTSSHANRGIPVAPQPPAGERQPPPNPAGPRGISPLASSENVSSRHAGLGPKSPVSGYRSPPEYPRPNPPFSSPLMAKSTSSLNGGGGGSASGGGPRTISAAAFRRQQARSPSGVDQGPADTSPLAVRRRSPSPSLTPMLPLARLSVANPDPRSSDEEDREDVGAYSVGGDNGGYGSGKYVSDLERR